MPFPYCLPHATLVATADDAKSKDREFKSADNNTGKMPFALFKTSWKTCLAYRMSVEVIRLSAVGLAARILLMTFNKVNWRAGSIVGVF